MKKIFYFILIYLSIINIGFAGYPANLITKFNSLIQEVNNTSTRVRPAAENAQQQCTQARQFAMQQGKSLVTGDAFRLDANVDLAWGSRELSDAFTAVSVGTQLLTVQNPTQEQIDNLEYATNFGLIAITDSNSYYYSSMLLYSKAVFEYQK